MFINLWFLQLLYMLINLTFVITFKNLIKKIMSLLEKIDADIKAAMRAREKEKLEALRAVKNAILVQRTEKGSGGSVASDDEIKLLKRLVKQRKEAAELYRQQNRDDLAQVEEFQSGIIEVYLPEQLSEEKIVEMVKEIISKTGATGMKDMGKVMGLAAKDLTGKADNKMVSDIVKRLLS